MRVYFLSSFILLLLTYGVCQNSGVKPVSDSRRAVRSAASQPSSGSDITFFKFDFLHPYLGYEGPNFSELEGEPSAGVEYLAEAELLGQQDIVNAKFEMIDALGNVIQGLRFSKANNSLADGDFYGLVKVPSESFRVKVSGTGINGVRYERIYERMFRPTNTPPKPGRLPPVLSPAEANRAAEALRQVERQAKTKIETGLAKHPDGVIVMPRVRVSSVTYEPYISDKGNTLGIRLRYGIEYTADGDYAHSLHMFPDYRDTDLRGLVEMQVIKETIEPKPAPPSYATPNIHVDLESLVKYGSGAWYRGGIVYQFVIDLVPDFVGQNATKTKFCVDETHYEQKVKSRKVWELMKNNGAPVAYSISMREANYFGNTEPFMALKVFYDGFLKEGAVPCKPYKNIYF
jgi:hypothetical protein